jgi:hypothetical protein
VDIGDQRNANAPLDFAQLLGGFAHRHGAADDVAAGGFQGPNLLHCGPHIPGIGFGHRLNGDRRIAAHFQLANL